MNPNLAQIVLLTLIKRIAAPPTNCGCFFLTPVSADCSNQASTDFECLVNKNLTDIRLNNNKYTEFPKELDANRFQSIEHIDLSNNNIENLPDNLEDFKNLQSVNFTYNNMTDPRELLHINVKIKIFIEHNPYKCDCEDSNKLQEKAKVLGTRIWCCTPQSKNKPSIPLASLCPTKFYHGEKKVGNTGKMYVWIAGIIAVVIIVLAFHCCGK